MDKHDGPTESKPHPIIALRVVGVDGAETLTQRVYCRSRASSVALDRCRTCEHCAEIRSADDGGWVDCAPPTSEHEQPVPVGAVLKNGLVGVLADVPLRRALALFAQRGLKTIAILGANGCVLGALRERDVLEHFGGHRREVKQHRLALQVVAAEPVGAALSGIRTVVEATPLRKALLEMATAHEREVLIVTEQGEAVGLLSDVDAMLAYAAMQRGEL